MLERRSDNETIEEKRRAKLTEKSPLNLQRENQALKEKLSTDNLTGLLNQEAFKERMNDLIAEFRGRRAGDHLARVSFLMVDADNFKHVNDTYGHPVGDQVLKLIAEAIKKHTRSDMDFAARWAGDEFAVCYENAGDVAVAKGEDIRQEVETSEVVLPDGQSVKITVSIGIAETTGLREVERLYQQADKALYDSKGQGKNRVVVAGLLKD